MSYNWASNNQLILNGYGSRTLFEWRQLALFWIVHGITWSTSDVMFGQIFGLENPHFQSAWLGVKG